jgi:hypothetical protein
LLGANVSHLAISAEEIVTKRRWATTDGATLTRGAPLRHVRLKPPR